ncbi:hypothetical protein L323_13445 [Ruminiclostridium papyrosolvens C7]|uniref:Lipoprotein n=1 Tax=Ruminiclostridium papyrosolvens C7 TaxID=1330534 RepID=U4R0A2_9FIRM|nr:hypothetical protein L323_13445 [Ruminiclostridium papyrosolvens C7]
MKRKILVLFILLCFIISSTGCFNKKSQAKVSSYHTKDTKLMPSINGSYLIWQDNIRAKIVVYNCKSNKMYSLAQKVGNDDTVSCIGIYNNVLFWYENYKKNTIYKYAVLK